MARASTTSDVFNAVAEPRRREILSYLAGMERPDGPIDVGDPARSDTDRLLGGAGLSAETIEGLRARGVVA